MENKKYSSIKQTQKHANRVDELINQFSTEIIKRGKIHDKSKMESPELETFDEYTPKLKNCTFGSDEYKGYLKGMGTALKHHYENNSHHPEHYKNGINGMDLVDLVEMFCDWMAASERHADGNYFKSLDVNKDRFNMSDQMSEIFKNTIERFFNKE